MLTDAGYLASLPPRKRLAAFLQQPRIVLEAAVECLDAGQVSPPQEALTPVELAPPVPKRKRTERKAGGPAPGIGSQMVGGESLVAAALSKALALRLVAQQAYVRAAELRQVRHGDKENRGSCAGTEGLSEWAPESCTHRVARTLLLRAALPAAEH
jgi:hypothetical protein